VKNNSNILLSICIVLQIILCYTNCNEERAPDRTERQEGIQRLEIAMEQNNTSGKDYGLYIEGHYVEPRGSARLPVINPATGETWATM
jgi:hypothetical protein